MKRIKLIKGEIYFIMSLFVSACHDKELNSSNIAFLGGDYEGIIAVLWPGNGNKKCTSWK